MRIDPAEIEALFDAIPSVLFFAKDTQGRYTHVNMTMMQRLGMKSRSEVIGKRADEVYPAGMSEAYVEQDARVLGGEVIENVMELQLLANRQPGWCLTCKRPIIEHGKVVGLIGISRDLGQRGGLESQYEPLRLALEYLSTHYAENVRMQTLLDITGFSLSKLERSFRKVFQMTPQQVLTRLRIQIALHLLHGKDSVASIGQACGFSDQSAFTRKFKAEVGMAPRQYRALIAERAQAAEADAGD
ncbi:AraC family transcriptional regulator [Stenotrophomonas pictorum JCM 9942]|uniref:AraC family transcriptional regulator n=1 Tax=Stenotrophomonas pictorum JCM 9942 TaxID=1236960 RepID=A0A0R0ALB9_9GAMM|nr:AraC family transcriptional regulator [Stenotrophomonas pictorum]KRG42490.1 AraC family transcriptional regulator [Stenotrophomonas pictorum JCM 9942]